MITIVTGEMNSGKTTKLLDLYKQNSGAGFVLIKKMDNEQILGFDYLELGTNKSGVFIRKEKMESVRDTLGPYYFSGTAFEYIEASFEKYLINKMQPLYLDEVGQLELDKRGYFFLIKKILRRMDQATHLYLTVRKKYLKEVINEFQLKNVTIIEVDATKCDG